MPTIEVLTERAQPVDPSTQASQIFARFQSEPDTLVIPVVEDGRPVSVIGNKDNPVYHGYTCAKGRALPEQHANPHRLLHTMKRDEDGAHRPIPVEQSMDEIAEKVARIVEEHGPRSVALYTGTFSFPYAAGPPMAPVALISQG